MLLSVGKCDLPTSSNQRLRGCVRLVVSSQKGNISGSPTLVTKKTRAFAFCSYECMALGDELGFTYCFD